MVDGFARPGSPGLLGSSTVVRNATRVANLEQTSRFCARAASLCGVHEVLGWSKTTQVGTMAPPRNSRGDAIAGLHSWKWWVL